MYFGHVADLFPAEWQVARGNQAFFFGVTCISAAFTIFGKTTLKRLNRYVKISSSA
jgi:hypothetical protein